MGREVHVVVLILLSIFEVWMCYQVLYRTVLDKKYLRTWQKVLIWVNILGVGTLMGINRNMFYFSHIMFWIQIVVTVAMISVLHTNKWYINFEIVSIFCSLVSILDFFFAFCGIMFLDNFWFSVYVYGESPWKCIMFVLTRMIMAAIVFLFNKIERRDMLIEGTQKIFIPTAVVLLIIIRFYQYVIYDIMNGLTDTKGWSAACSLMAVTSVASFCMVVCWKNQSLKNEKQLLELREKLELKNQEDINQVLEINRIHVHDMRHHLILLKEFLATKEYQVAENYLDELMDGFLQKTQRTWTRIRSLDILLNAKKQEAEMLNIRLRIEVDVLKKWPFKETETCVLFGNLLDNSIEACRKIKDGKREIVVEIRQKKSFLFITVTNTIEQLPEIKKGKLISNKGNKDIHGYGLKSVERILKTYDGSFKYEIENKIFKVFLCFSNE